MAIHFLNCFTCNARFPSHWRTGALCLLLETDRGLVLVDTGLGSDDYLHKSAVLRLFQLVTIVPLDPQEAAVHQLAHLGYRPQDVRHIVLTHMHFDHCGGLPDFPHATVHVHRRELDAFTGRLPHWTAFGYVRRHIAHQPRFALYEPAGETWFDLPAIRLPFEPSTWLVPLLGHTPGHCGVAVHTDSGWLFHVGSAAPLDYIEEAPRWFVRLVLGQEVPLLRQFQAAHPEVRITTGHMPLDFFPPHLAQAPQEAPPHTNA
jgi:glyoxylase-like metal-dependent hydrolase (beta-lactamase superfamily II)